jgi:hypothetical protein
LQGGGSPAWPAAGFAEQQQEAAELLRGGVQVAWDGVRRCWRALMMTLLEVVLLNLGTRGMQLPGQGMR